MEPNDFKFNLGDVLRCSINGFEGVCVSRSQWLANCNTYGIQPRDLDDKGMPKESKHFDEPLLALVETGAITPSRETGGPERIPGRTTNAQ